MNITLIICAPDISFTPRNAFLSAVPEPQPDHAQRISKFAGDCMIKMKELVAVLEEELGEGTSKLSFRVGLNSGGVTVSSLIAIRAS